MTSELIIDAQPKEVTIALLEDQKLVEFQKEGQDSKYSVGNIYAGKVKKIMPALNACFVDVGHEREAFASIFSLWRNTSSRWSATAASLRPWQRLQVSQRWRKWEAFRTCSNSDRK